MTSISISILMWTDGIIYAEQQKKLEDFMMKKFTLFLLALALTLSLCACGGGQNQDSHPP